MSLATNPLHQWLEDPALIFNALPDGLALLDSNGYIRFLNTSWRHPTFAVGKSCLECFQSLAVLDTIAEQQMAEGVQAILKGNQSRMVMEYRVGETSSAGAVISWFSLTMLPYPSQESHGVLIQQHDITERKRIETQLRKNTDHAELLVEISHALDEEGRNHQAVLDTIAHRVTLLLGDACMIRLLSDDRQWLVPVAWYHPDPTIREVMWQAMIGTPQYAYEYLGGEVVRTGQPILLSNLTPQDIHRFFKPTYAQYLERFRVFSIVSVPLRAQGKVIGIITAFRNTGSSYTHEDKLLLQDISERAALAIVNARLFEDVQRELAERKQAQEELHKNQQLLHSVISNVPIMLFAIEKHGIITLAEGKGLSLIDEPRTLVGMSYQEAFHDQTAYRQHIASVLAGGEEAEVLDIWGKPFDVRSLPLVDDVGTITGMISVATDYTDHMRVEEAQREAIAAAQAATQAKSEFLANMSHEIRTPMNAIIGMTNLLLDTVLTTEQQEFVETVHKSSSTLLTIINDILDFSKIEAGKLNLEYYPFDLRQCLEESLDLFATEATDKKLDLVYFIEDNLPMMIAGDATRLRQILVNLLSNAVKFTRNEGAIGLQVTSDHDVIQFTVWDTGIGIAEEHIELLFRPFVQLDSSLSREHVGTGLGLALVARLSELLGGSVTVESSLEVGSRFIVKLPLQQGLADDQEQTSDQRPAHVSAPLPTKDTLILVVDDNETNLNLYSEYLQMKGYHIVVARNGEEAIERTRERKPQLILMDIQMPKMSGLEAIEKIRAHAYISHIPIIALTALAMPGDRERCFDAGANDYLSKPVNLRGLLQAIEQQLM
jgi:PAS domain S-box-containing protein